jgi:hypothetical protein
MSPTSTWGSAAAASGHAVQARWHNIPRRRRSNTKQVVIHMCDGGANLQPMKRDAAGNATTTQSWYTPTGGNNDKPCHDAVAQANIAEAIPRGGYPEGRYRRAARISL